VSVRVQTVSVEPIFSEWKGNESLTNSICSHQEMLHSSENSIETPRLLNDLNTIPIVEEQVRMSLFADDKIFDVETLETLSSHSQLPLEKPGHKSNEWRERYP
jgi:hypothetical protein